MVKISFGPTGVGPVKDVVKTLERYSEEGLKAAEFAFTYGAYIKKEDAIEIRRKIRDLSMSLSIHAPYYVNLNSKEKEKVEASKKRILACCEIGHYLGVKRIVFHAGFYSGMTREDAFQNIKREVLALMKEIKKHNWAVELCPEVMGKINVFGSIEEISRLVDETGCSFCIDFAHVLARYKDYNFELIKESFPQKEWHCHFSGIEYGDKGEKNHILTKKEEWKKLLDFLSSLKKEVVIINESPSPEEDAVKGLELFKSSDK